MGWIPLCNGRPLELAAPDPNVLDVYSLASALSRLCRFGGHVRSFYSVAQHSVLAESIIPDDRPELRLPALLHDGHESLWGFGDPQAPARNLDPVIRDWLNAHARPFDEAIAQRFGFDAALFHDPLVKHADEVALATEKRDIAIDCGREWRPLPDPLPERIEPLGETRAMIAFISRFNELFALQEAA